MFSNEEVIKFGDQSKILKMYELIDYYKSIQTKVKKYFKNKLRKRILFLNEKIRNKVDEIHWKTINYLTNNYNNILLPEFETQKMTNNLHRKVNRKMMFWQLWVQLKMFSLTVETILVKFISNQQCLRR